MYVLFLTTVNKKTRLGQIQVALEEAMKIYRLYKPTLVCTFVISILIKAIWLKSYHHKKTNTSYRCKR